MMKGDHGPTKCYMPLLGERDMHVTITWKSHGA